MNPVFARLGQTVFDEMSGLAREFGAINLGQGFPEDDGPLAIREVAAKSLIEGPNQYPPMRGLPTLREAVADHYRRFQNIDLDWRNEVTITSGATEALAAALLAVLQPGDEAVLFAPAYDSYAPIIRAAGATPRYVQLAPPHWTFSDAALDAAFSPRTRAVIVNTPLNPVSSVLSAATFMRIAARCVAHDAIAISDEVWEHVTFDGVTHASMLAAPGMRGRTIKIGSAGKMFSMTGWKVGFVCAAPALTDVLARAHQFLTFTTPPNLQVAAAFGLRLDETYFAAMRDEYQRARDRLIEALRSEGIVSLPARGSYFLTIDLPASGIVLDDRAFALHAVKNAGVAVIPLSAFYESEPETRFVRLCFAKRDATLDKGAAALARARDLLIGG